eukprot:7661125-Pyramimonas_sp.AAC.2
MGGQRRNRGCAPVPPIGANVRFVGRCSPLRCVPSGWLRTVTTWLGIIRMQQKPYLSVFKLTPRNRVTDHVTNRVGGCRTMPISFGQSIVNVRLTGPFLVNTILPRVVVAIIYCLCRALLSI